MKTRLLAPSEMHRPRSVRQPQGGNVIQRATAAARRQEKEEEDLQSTDKV
jgi:hypothetical protein